MGYKKRYTIRGLIKYIFLICVCLFVLGPIIWFTVTSLKTSSSIVSYPPKWLPQPITFQNYEKVVSDPHVPRYFLNSTVIALATIALTLILASHISYATSRIKFKYSDITLLGILATSMVPAIAILPALYVMSIRLNLFDSYLVLVLVFSAWQIPVVTWIMKGFIESIPKEIEEAALLDGCSRLQVFYRIVFPVCQPGFAASALLIFIYVWNDWLVPSSLTISLDKRTVPLGLYNYVTDLGIDWGRFTAYTMLLIIPVVVLFLILQSRFIEGLTAGASKG